MTEKKDKPQSARAARLHEEIEEIKQGTSDPGNVPTPPAKPLSPREFIHKRMRELKGKK